MVKKTISVMLAVMLCFLTVSIHSQAALIYKPMNPSKEAGRSVLHPTGTGWNSNNTIKVAINYSMQDSTGEIVGVLSANIAESVTLSKGTDA